MRRLFCNVRFASSYHFVDSDQKRQLKLTDSSNGSHSDALTGCLLGTALADALGLPYEGLSPRRASKIWGQPDRFHLLFGWGLVSDDTEHSCLVLQAWMASNDSPDRFARLFARKLKNWFLLLPAGIGMATARACLKLCVGVPASRSGVFSAGNGPAMRSAVLGVIVDDPEKLRTFVRASSRVTHTDPKAEQGAMAVALAAHTARDDERPDADHYFQQLREQWSPGEATDFLEEIAAVETSLRQDEPTREFARSRYGEKGVSGYVLQTVPVALHAWLRHPRDWEAAVTEVIQCGGDTDTVAAIVGGIIGAGIGKQGLPRHLLDHLVEWPRSVKWMERLAEAAANRKEKPPRCFPGFVFVRNLAFLVVVLIHGFRRLVPPY